MPRHYRLQLQETLSDFNSFGTDIPDIPGHPMTFNFFTSPKVCFCATWGKQVEDQGCF